VITLSGAADRRSMIDFYDAGADDYLVKSNDGEVLRVRVLSQIRRRQRLEETRQLREELLRQDFAAAEQRALCVAAQERTAHAAELELQTQEMDAFTAAVAHDLGAALRGIDGFSLALLEDYGDVLDAAGKKYLAHIRNSTVHMARLIDDLRKLSTVARSEFLPGTIDLSAIAQLVAGQLRDLAPSRKVEFEIEPGLTASGDPALLRVALENLLGNAWKFTGRKDPARISFSAQIDGGQQVFVVRDNGVGFDRALAGKLFNVFTRLHSTKDFAGTGIGLATTLRVVRRHGGKIWADGELGKGAAFFFTLEARA
jgi:signal transduction histidine kinase